MTKKKKLTVRGAVPAMDGTQRLIPITIDVTDPVMIEKIERGLIKDFSLEIKSANEEH